MSAFDRLHPALQHHIVNSLGWRELRPVQDLSIDAYLDGANLVDPGPDSGRKDRGGLLSRHFPDAGGIVGAACPSSTSARSGRSSTTKNNVFAATSNWSDDGRPAGTETRRRAKSVGSWPNRRTACSPRPSRWKSCWFRRRSTTAVLRERPHGRRSTNYMPSPAMTGVGTCSRSSPASNGWPGGTFSGSACRRRWAIPKRCWRGCRRAPQRPKQVISTALGRRSKHRTCNSTTSVRWRMRPRSSGLLHEGEKRLVFCDSRSRVEQLALLLREQGVETFVSHSSLGLDDRRQAEQAFAQRQNCVIVATSSLELGLDVGDLDRVIQIDAPPTVSSFLQRMGRTGRRAAYNAELPFPGDDRRGAASGRGPARTCGGWFRRAGRRAAEALPHPGPAVDGAGPARTGIGRTDWFRWVETVPGFRRDGARRLSRTLSMRSCSDPEFSGADQGILSFAPEGRGRSSAKGTSWSFCPFSPRPRSSGLLLGPEGTRVRSRIDLLQAGRRANDPGARRSKLEDESSGLETPDRPRRADRRAGTITMAW